MKRTKSLKLMGDFLRQIRKPRRTWLVMAIVFGFIVLSFQACLENNPNSVGPNSSSSEDTGFQSTGNGSGYGGALGLGTYYNIVENATCIPEPGQAPVPYDGIIKISANGLIEFFEGCIEQNPVVLEEADLDIFGGNENLITFTDQKLNFQRLDFAPQVGDPGLKTIEGVCYFSSPTSTPSPNSAGSPILPNILFMQVTVSNEIGIADSLTAEVFVVTTPEVILPDPLTGEPLPPSNEEPLEIAPFSVTLSGNQNVGDFSYLATTPPFALDAQSLAPPANISRATVSIDINGTTVSGPADTCIF